MLGVFMLNVVMPGVQLLKLVNSSLLTEKKHLTNIILKSRYTSPKLKGELANIYLYLKEQK